MVTDEFGLTFTIIEDTSEWRPQYPVVDIEQEEVYTHPSCNFISIRPPPYTKRKKPCVRVSLGEALPTIDICREDGELRQKTHLASALEGGVEDWEV